MLSSETRLGTPTSRPVTLRRLPRLVQSFEPLDDQLQIRLLTASVFKRLDELSGLELSLPDTVRPVPVDFMTH